MADEKKIRFSGDASGLTSMFQKLKEDAKQVNKELIQDALKYSQSSKEQIKFIEEQIKAIERRNSIDYQGRDVEMSASYSSKIKGAKSGGQRDEITDAYKSQVKRFSEEKKSDDLQIQLLKDLVDTIKDSAKQDLLGDKAGAAKKASEIIQAVQEGKGDNFSEDEKLKAYITRDLTKPEEKEEKKESMFSSMFSALMVDRLVSAIDSTLGTVIGAKSSEDMIKPAATMLGAGLGGAVGAGVNMLTLGTSGATAIGLRLGEMLGSKYGDAYNRHIEERQNFLTSQNRLSALTTSGGGSASDFGLSKGQLLQLQEQVFKSSYDHNNLDERSRVTLGLEKGYGVDRGTLMSRYSSDVFTDSSSENDILKTVSVLKQNGIISDKNNLPLESFLKNQTALIASFSNAREKVSTDEITKTILGFNNLGGGYQISDPRSLQRIENIHQGLTSPSNDFMQAANFAVLKQTLGEGASFLDIMKAQEQGLGGDKGMEFFKNYVDMIVNRGGSEENQTLSLRQRFPGMSIEQAQSVISGKDNMSNYDIKNFSKEGTLNTVLNRGIARTTEIEQQGAQIADAFVSGAIEGIETVGKLFIDKMISILKDSFDKEVTKMRSEMRNTVHK